MESSDLQSVIGLTIQCAGIFLVTVLSFFMTRSIRRPFLNYWTAAWASLAISLLSLSVAFRVPSLAWIGFPIYFFGEYLFGFMFIAGCRNYAGGERLTKRRFYLLIPAAVLAILLTLLSKDFSIPFIPHAAIFATLFALGYRALRPARQANASSPGLRVMSVALVLLTLDFLHYVPLLSFVEVTRTALPIGYLRFTSIYDLILETLLGFGTLMLVMDESRHEVEAANRELIATRDRLEVLARVDPLTEALNRHAFHSLLDTDQSNRSTAVSGCVVVLDIDNLKPINDSLGHAAGDEAIREVARSIRSIIRADDLLFRWGGDEFLILFFNITESGARERIDHLDSALSRSLLPGASEAIRLIVSFGVAPFSTMNGIEAAIDCADSAMYACKLSRKEIVRPAVTDLEQVTLS